MRTAARASFLTLALALLATAPVLGDPPAVGATVPDLTLSAIDGSEYTLSHREGPTVLVFFRGVW